MTTGYTLDPEDLRAYAGKLTAKKSVVGEIDGLVGQADVGDESWGLVGLFVKQKYTDMLGDLTDLLKDMQDGLQSGADKFTGAAAGYDAKEDEAKQLLDGLLVRIDNTAPPVVL
jgi:hypothetical protein